MTLHRLLVVLPSALTAARSRRQVREALQAQGFEVLLPRCREPREISALIRAHSAVEGLVTAADPETVSAVLTVWPSDRPWLLLPLGSDRQLCEELQLWSNWQTAIAQLKRASSCSIPVGLVDDRPFLGSLKLGLSQPMAGLHQQWRQYPWQSEAVRAALKLSWLGQRFQVEGKTASQQWSWRTTQLQIACGHDRRFWLSHWETERSPRPGDPWPSPTRQQVEAPLQIQAHPSQPLWYLGQRLPDGPWHLQHRPQSQVLFAPPAVNPKAVR
ncbi:hypothetical protein [Synechococcus elongatus]|uniref:hypothetical protein n=1 Tax=Synechococcus elongatus TaxID=32046 RepID=UPI0030D23EFB